MFQRQGRAASLPLRRTESPFLGVGQGMSIWKAVKGLWGAGVGIKALYSVLLWATYHYHSYSSWGVSQSRTYVLNSWGGVLSWICCED